MKKSLFEHILLKVQEANFPASLVMDKAKLDAIRAQAREKYKLDLEYAVRRLEDRPGTTLGQKHFETAMRDALKAFDTAPVYSEDLAVMKDDAKNSNKFYYSLHLGPIPVSMKSRGKDESCFIEINAFGRIGGGAQVMGSVIEFDPSKGGSNKFRSKMDKGYKVVDIGNMEAANSSGEGV